MALWGCSHLTVPQTIMFSLLLLTPKGTPQVKFPNLPGHLDNCAIHHKAVSLLQHRCVFSIEGEPPTIGVLKIESKWNLLALRMRLYVREIKAGHYVWLLFLAWPICAEYTRFSFPTLCASQILNNICHMQYIYSNEKIPILAHFLLITWLGICNCGACFLFSFLSLLEFNLTCFEDEVSW